MIIKGIQCKKCFNNKRKIIRSDDDLTEWLNLKKFENKIRSVWIKKLNKEGFLLFYWCKEQAPFSPQTKPLHWGANYKNSNCPKIKQ